MTVCDQDYDLKENLPAFLEQKYEPGFEVIVVDEASTDETPDVLKLFKNEHKNLYTTFLPKPEYFVKRKMQAYNIGIKAAKNDWIIFVNANHTCTTVSQADFPESFTNFVVFSPLKSQMFSTVFLLGVFRGENLCFHASVSQ